MAQTAERDYGPEHWGGDTYQSKISAGASEQLTLEMNLYQECMEEHYKDQETNSLDPLRRPEPEGLLVDRCAQSLAKLAKRAAPDTAYGDELVVFEVYNGEHISIAAISYWLHYHMVGYDFQYTSVVFTPRWVYDMMRKALQHEKAVLSWWPASQITSKIGDAYQVRSIKDVLEANTLWDPVLGHGIYKNYGEALHAVQLL